jgi:hypothetical protein
VKLNKFSFKVFTFDLVEPSFSNYEMTNNGISYLEYVPFSLRKVAKPSRNIYHLFVSTAPMLEYMLESLFFWENRTWVVWSSDPSRRQSLTTENGHFVSLSLRWESTLLVQSILPHYYKSFFLFPEEFLNLDRQISWCLSCIQPYSVTITNLHRIAFRSCPFTQYGRICLSIGFNKSDMHITCSKFKYGQIGTKSELWSNGVPYPQCCSYLQEMHWTCIQVR